MVGPVEFAIWRKRSVGGTFAAHPGAKDEADDEADKAKDEHKDAQVPDERRIVELEDNDESEADEEEAQIEEEHQAAAAPRVGAHGMRGSGRLHHDPAPFRRLGPHGGVLHSRASPIGPIRSMAEQSR